MLKASYRANAPLDFTAGVTALRDRIGRPGKLRRGLLAAENFSRHLSPLPRHAPASCEPDADRAPDKQFGQPVGVVAADGPVRGKAAEPEPQAGPARLKLTEEVVALACTETCSTGAAFYLPDQTRRSAITDNVARRGRTMPMGHRAWFLALVGVCIFLASLALAGCGSATAARPVSPGFTGYDWQVVAISHGGQETTIPAEMRVGLRFSPGGQFGADDSVNFHSGTYRTTGDGFTTDDLSTTLVGYGGHDPAVLLAMGAMDSFGKGVRATVKLTGDRLVVGVGSYTLTCQRGSPRADDPAPASTGG